MADYIALMRKDKKSDYGVDFPDFPGCVSAGKTMEEAREMAQEALTGHIEVMLEHGDPIPDPTPAEKIMADPDNKDAVAFLVTVRAKKPKAKRINITFPEDVLDEVDSYLKTEPGVKGMNRSRFLVLSASSFIRGISKEEMSIPFWFAKDNVPKAKDSKKRILKGTKKTAKAKPKKSRSK